MDVYVAGLKGWIEELTVKNKTLEKENETLKNTGANSMKQLEHENNQLKKDNESLKLLKQENIQLKQEKDSLKLEISELKKGPEIIDVFSDSDDDNNEQRNPKKRQRIDCGEVTSDADGTIEGQSDQNETVPIETNPFMIEKVVTTFMNFVSPSDLPACRLICKMWNVEATKQMKMRSTFRLDFCEVDRFLEIARRPFYGFRNLVMNIKELDVFANIRFRTLFKDHGRSLHRVDMELGNCIGFEMYEFRDLFLIPLQEIKSLTLQGLPCVLIHERKIFYYGYQIIVLPNLTEISIVLQVNCSRDHPKTQVFADLLRIAPNLKTLEWKETQFVLGHNSNATKLMIEALIEVNPPKLESLFLYSEVQPAAVKRLANSQLKLKRLHFSELNGFKVDLVAPCTGRKIELTPLGKKYSQVSGEELKKELEDKLAKFQQALCIELLDVFLSLPAVKLTGSGG